MHWKEQLKAKIENDWNKSRKTLVIPGRFYRYVQLKVHSDLTVEDDFLLLRQVLGYINADRFCGTYRGSLLFLNYQFTSTGAELTFGLRLCGGWNEEEEVWPYFDFDSLP